MSELDVLQARDEVLQAMYWMMSEGIDSEPTARELSRFLAVPHDRLATFMERFVDDGYLEHAGEGYKLTAEGTNTGKRSFAEEFADLTRPTHGECDEDCWCHESPEDAARCLEERTGQQHAVH